MNFEQIRVDLLQTKSELAMARVNLARAANEVRRNTPLFHEKLVSEDLYDISVKTRDMYQAEVTAKTDAVAEIERRMAELQPLATPTSPGLAGIDLLQESVNRLEQSQRKVATNWAALVLRAPISGMVNLIHRREGEYVVDGEPLFVINSQWADRIVGYLRQPYPVDPQVGMAVRVSTREYKSRNFSSEISQVGAQLETITNSLAYIRQGSLVDAGLPVVIEIPKGLKIRPGESVDLVFRGRPAAVPRIEPAGDKSPQTAELQTP
jgi:multidrug resistance efflux pump